MGRDIHFFNTDCTKLDSESDDEYQERYQFAGVDLGSGDAWPCYFRPIMIGAYKRAVSQNLSESILRSLLACCPPNHTKTNNDSIRCGYYHRLVVVENSFCNRQNMLNERALFDEHNQLNIHKAGVWSILELLLMHNRMPLTTPTIRRVSEMMELVRNYVPYSEEDLTGTPYADADDSYNVADTRWIELFDAFKTAATFDNVYAIIE
jgi:hypothetical protein